MQSLTPGRRLHACLHRTRRLACAQIEGISTTQNSLFSELCFRFRAYTLHLAELASFFLFRHLPFFSHSATGRLTDLPQRGLSGHAGFLLDWQPLPGYPIQQLLVLCVEDPVSKLDTSARGFGARFIPQPITLQNVR